MKILGVGWRKGGLNTAKSCSMESTWDIQITGNCATAAVLEMGNQYFQSGFSIPFYSQHLDLLSLMSPFQTLQKGKYGNLLLTLHTLVLNYL